MANYLSIEKRKRIFHLLCEGNGQRSILRLTGCSKNTVSELQKRYSLIIEFINRKYIKELIMDDIEADEIRTFILKKNNVRWVYVALDRKSRMVVHFHIGKRNATDARIFLIGLSGKLNKKCKVSTDCLKSYVTAVMVTPNGYLPHETEAIDLLRARYLGNKLGREISNRVETHNGNIRQHVSRLTRRTRCFSKREEGLRQHLTLFFFYYNFLKVHQALKTTPCLAAKVIDTPFSIDNLIEYDLMFTGKLGNVNPKNYGKVENKITKSESQLFIKEMKGKSGIILNSRKGIKYRKKLKVVA